MTPDDLAVLVHRLDNEVRRLRAALELVAAECEWCGGTGTATSKVTGASGTCRNCRRARRALR